MSDLFRLSVRSLLLAGVTAAFAPIARAQSVSPDGEYLVIQFDEVDGTPLDDFIKYCEIRTGLMLNYSGADTKDTKLKFLGKKRIKQNDFWSFFQAVLKSYDFVVVPYGNIAAPGRSLEGPDTGYFAIRKSSGGNTARPGYIKTQAPVVSPAELDQFKYDPGIVLTTSFALKYVNAQEATNTLQAYFTDPQLESVRAVTNSNTLVMTGFAQTLAQIQRLIELLDTQPAEYKPRFGRFELKYGVAEEIKPIVDQLIAAERGEATGTRGQVQAAAQSNLPASLQEPAPHVEADARTNALYVIAAEKSLEKIGQYIRMLDVEVDPRGDTHVYRLKNSKAKDLAEILNDWANSSQSGSSGGARSGPTAGGAAATSSGGSSSLEQPVNVVADEGSNSLVISASKSRYAQVLEVIKRLDVRRRQVLIETALVEISGTLDDALGVELGYLSIDDQGGTGIATGGFGLSNFGLSTLEDTNGDGIADTRVPIGLSDGFSGTSGITAGIFGGKNFQVPVVINALETTTDANVLSMPSVLVNDNEKATIKSIDERPSFTVSQGQVSDQTSFKEYIQAGIQLDISPSISAGNYLRLGLRLEVSAFLPGNTDPPPRTTRELDAAVTLPDGHTMVIGGIVRDDQRSNSDKIPWLGDFPLIGFLFRNGKDADARTNLYIFLTPHIVSDDFATLDDLSFKKKKEMETLNGKIYLVDDDWDRNNADTRVLDAAVSGVFNMPSYASPAAGERTEKPKPVPTPTDDGTFGEVNPAPTTTPPPQQSKP